MAPHIVLVTGGNTGIGYETVKCLLGSTTPYHILMGSRSLEKGKLAVEKLHKELPAATNTVEVIQLDLTSDESIAKAFEQVKAAHDHVDTLVNNAGASFDIEYVRNRISLRAMFNRAYDVNVTGTNVFTHTFMPLLLVSSDPRLLFVAGLSHMTEAMAGDYKMPPVPAGWPKNLIFEAIGYRCSKTALHMLMLDWHHKLKEDGVKVWAVQPGFLATGLGGDREVLKQMGAGDPSQGGEVVSSVVAGERDADVGKVLTKNGLCQL
ncbi:hypothetical protein B0T22DRAFT_527154 [Podospora appendiculata]|uniref:Uncharacterized protein n=1 Tax=Podospora appendiculata TaxID=314037 RepID=A0AAE0X7C3_9PEZI|nr:hypothetical protein B0T22DRAFT_527154 [Podospora appendiculata]